MPLPKILSIMLAKSWPMPMKSWTEEVVIKLSLEGTSSAA